MKKYPYLINSIFFISILLIIIHISHSECDINTPILTPSGCQLKYCSNNEFDSGACNIDNSIVKTQWLNDIIIFDSNKLRYGSFTINSEGDLIYECSTEKDPMGIRVIYWLKKNGSFYFQNDNGEKVSTKILTVNNNDESSPLRYESSIVSVSINGNEKYLLSVSLWEGETELYNFGNLSISHKTTKEFMNYNIYSTVSPFIKIDNGDKKEYLHTFIGQHIDDENYQNFFLISQTYSFNSFNINYGVSIQQKINKRVINLRIISNYKTDSYYIYFYIEYNNANNNHNYVIESYNNNFQYLSSHTINNGLAFDDNLFYKSIYMKNDLGVFIFYKNKDIHYPQIKIISVISGGYGFSEKFDFELSSPGGFSTSALLNDMIKINNNRFCFISSSQYRKKLYIILFDFYNNDNNIKERIYNIKLNDLYNYIIYRELTSILYNNYLALSMSVCKGYPCEENDENSISNFFSFLIIFGYINGTNTNINISKFLSEFKDVNEINNNNIIDNLLKNITFDNNIFGYKYQKKIKLIDMSDELIFYNIENGEKIKVNKGDNLNYNYEISQNNNLIKMGNKNYYFEFQYIAQEPDVNAFNQYAIDIKTINAIGNSNSGTENFESQILYGKTIKIEFKLCYDLCDTCEYLGISENDQKCLSCYENYTLINGNCYLTEKLPPTTVITTILTTIITTLPETTIITTLPETTIITSLPETTIITSLPETTIITTLPETTELIIPTTKIGNKNNNGICLSNYNSDDDNECIELCSEEDLLADNCGMNSENKNTIIYNLIKNYIKNYTGEENLIIEADEDYVFQLTNSLNEENTLNGGNNKLNLSMIDLNDCEEILKKENNIDKNVSLIIFKLEKVGAVASQKNIQYEVYNPITKDKLDLSVCDNNIDIYIPVTLDEETLDLQQNLLSYGYDIFDINNSFYQDICAQYTSVNGTDVLLSDRKKHFFNDTQTACQKDCKYSEYSAETKFLKCECSINDEEIEPEKTDKFNGIILVSSFYDVLKFSNFLVLKCYKLVFSYKGQFHNWGSILLIGYFIIYTIFNFMYFFKGYFYVKLFSAKMIFNNNILNENENNNNNKKNGAKRGVKRSKSMILKNPLKRAKTKRYTKKMSIDRFNSNSGKILLKNSGINKDEINLNNYDVIFNKKGKESNLNYRLTEKDKNKSKDEKQNTRILLKAKTKRTIIKRNKTKKKTFDNSIQLLRNISNRFKGINSSKTFKDSQFSNLKNINNNFNNRNSIQIFNKKRNSKEILNKIQKKNLFSFFKGNNFSDFELNELEYEKAVEYDKRTFFNYYWQLIRREHLIIFTFFSWDDYNVISIKLSKCIFAVALDFAVNVAFFFDDSMHKVYLDYGKYNFIAQIPQIIYSTAASESLDVFIRYLCLIEKDVYRIKQIEKKKNKAIAKQQIFKVLKCMRIKLILYFLVTFLFMSFFWYFVSAFCAVYKNTQIYLIKDSITSFGLSLLYPFALYIFPTSLRIISLLDKKKRLNFLYKLSDIIPLI